MRENNLNTFTLLIGLSPLFFCPSQFASISLYCGVFFSFLFSICITIYPRRLYCLSLSLYVFVTSLSLNLNLPLQPLSVCLSLVPHLVFSAPFCVIYFCLNVRIVPRFSVLPLKLSFTLFCNTFCLSAPSPPPHPTPFPRFILFLF